MTPREITEVLQKIFTPECVTLAEENNWQVVTPDVKLLVLLSVDQSWLRLLVPICTAAEAEGFLKELLEANFDQTHEVRYALNQGVLWGVFQHNALTITLDDLESAIAQLAYLNGIGLLGFFNDVIEDRLKQIIKLAKSTGQTQAGTLQQLRRLYEEGLLGGIEQPGQEREQFLKAWEEQLERLWPEL